MPIHKAAAIHPFSYRIGALEFLISKEVQLDAKDKVHTDYLHTTATKL